MKNKQNNRPSGCRYMKVNILALGNIVDVSKITAKALIKKTNILPTISTFTLQAN